VADHGEPFVAERIHQRDQVAGLGAGVVPVLGLVGQPHAALVDRDDLEVPGQRRHQQAPGVPALGPAVHQQQRRPLAAGDRVQAQLTGVDLPARERVDEPRREVRRAGDGARAFRVDGGAEDELMRIPFHKTTNRSSGSFTAGSSSATIVHSCERCARRRRGRGRQPPEGYHRVDAYDPFGNRLLMKPAHDWARPRAACPETPAGWRVAATPCDLALATASTTRGVPIDGYRAGRSDQRDAQDDVGQALAKVSRTTDSGALSLMTPVSARLVGYLVGWVTGLGVRRCARATGRRDPCGGRTPRSFRPAPRAATLVLRRCRADSRDRRR
jgi:hypothetical protein